MEHAPDQLTESPAGELEKRERDETAIVRRRYDRVAPFYDAVATDLSLDIVKRIEATKS